MPHLWQEAWCHLEHPGAAPREHACGKCPEHCQCPKGVRNNLPVKPAEESVQAFIERLSRMTRDKWTPK